MAGNTRPAFLAALGHLQRGARSLREACVPAPAAATLAATLHAQQLEVSTTWLAACLTALEHMDLHRIVEADACVSVDTDRTHMEEPHTVGCNSSNSSAASTGLAAKSFGTTAKSLPFAETEAAQRAASVSPVAAIRTQYVMVGLDSDQEDTVTPQPSAFKSSTAQLQTPMSARVRVELSDTDEEEQTQQEQQSVACTASSSGDDTPGFIAVARRPRAVAVVSDDDDSTDDDRPVVAPTRRCTRQAVNSGSEHDSSHDESESDLSKFRRSLQSLRATTKQMASTWASGLANAQLIDSDSDDEAPRPTRPPLSSVTKPTRPPITPASKLKVPNASTGAVGRARDENVPPPPPNAPAPSTIMAQSMTPAEFKKNRDELTKKLFVEFNQRVFGGQLPGNLEITWNAHLKTCAGNCTHSLWRRGNEQLYIAKISLSTKVLDSYDKLASTLCHELWTIDHTAKPPHGAVFQKWADAAMRAVPGMSVTTCHNYEIFKPFKFGCTKCPQKYERHSKSIKLDTQACGACGGKLEFLGRFKSDGTPVAKREATGFSLFVKEQYGSAKKTLGPGTPHKDVMKDLSDKWKGLSLGGKK